MDLEDENERLRQELAALRRQLSENSPTKAWIRPVAAGPLMNVCNFE